MAIRKLLLPLTGTAAGEGGVVHLPDDRPRLWNAHVTALHVRVDSRDVAPLAGEGLSGAMIEEMMSATEKESSERAHAVRSMFDRFVMQHDVILSEARPGAECATASFASVTGREEDLVAQQARLADLTVVPHPDAGEDVSSSDALHAVLFGLPGRPVLIAPQVASATVGSRVCLGWNGTAESSSAVYAALPWLQRADAVRILSAEGYQRRGPAAPDLAAYLALHGRCIADIVDVPVGAQFGRCRAAGGGAGVRLRPSRDGRLLAFAAASADFGRGDAACAGARQSAGNDEPLRRLEAGLQRDGISNGENRSAAGWPGVTFHDPPQDI